MCESARSATVTSVSGFSARCSSDVLLNGGSAGEAAAALAACPGTPALRAAVKKEAKANPGLAEAWKGVEKQLARPRGEEAQAAGAQAAR